MRPPVERAREHLINQLHSWVGIITLLPRIQSSRYQVICIFNNFGFLELVHLIMALVNYVISTMSVFPSLLHLYHSPFHRLATSRPLYFPLSAKERDFGECYSSSFLATESQADNLFTLQGRDSSFATKMSPISTDSLFDINWHKAKIKSLRPHQSKRRAEDC